MPTEDEIAKWQRVRPLMNELLSAKGALGDGVVLLDLDVPGQLPGAVQQAIGVLVIASDWPRVGQPFRRILTLAVG